MGGRGMGNKIINFFLVLIGDLIGIKLESF